MKRATFLMALLLVLALGLGTAVAQERLFIMIPHGPDQKEYNWIAEGIEAFQQRNPGVEVRFEGVAGWEFAEKLTLYLIAGEAPDVVMMMQRDVGGPIGPDAFLDLNQFLQSDDELDRSDFVASFMDYWSRGGKQLAMPINPDTGYIHYNIAMFNEAGLPLPPEVWPTGNWTWDDFRDIAQRLTRDLDGDGIPEQFGYDIGNHDWEPMWASWVFGSGGYVFDVESGVSGLREREAYEAMDFLYELMLQGIAGPGWRQQRAHLNAMSTLPAHWAQTWHDTGLHMGSFVQPTRDGTQSQHHVILGPGLLIMEHTRYPDLAWDLVKTLVSHESMVRLADLTNRLPSRLSAYRDWEILYEEKMRDGRYLLDAVQNGKGMPYNEQWSRMKADVPEALRQIILGESPAQAAFAELARRMEAYFE